MFMPAVGFKVTLKNKLLATDGILPLCAKDVAQLATFLTSKGSYTRLWISDRVGHEIIYVKEIVQGTVSVQRGEEGTRALTFPCGACVSFVWTAANLADFVQQGLGGRLPAVCEVKAGSDRLTVNKTGCEVTIDRPACPSIVWRSGNQMLAQNAVGCINSTPIKPAVTDGEYINATVTIQDGHITAIKSGTNIVYSGGGCCTCKEKA
jgi:hypothetical protein